jgi:hypothetical protein
MGHRYACMAILKGLMNQGFWKRVAIYRDTRQSSKTSSLQLLHVYFSILYTLFTGLAKDSRMLLNVGLFIADRGR